MYPLRLVWFSLVVVPCCRLDCHENPATEGRGLMTTNKRMKNMNDPTLGMDDRVPKATRAIKAFGEVCQKVIDKSWVPVYGFRCSGAVYAQHETNLITGYSRACSP